MPRYTKTTWVDNQVPAIDEDNLNKIEEGIYNAEGSVIAQPSDESPGPLSNKVKQSIEVDSDNKLHLEGDDAAPGPDTVYGTDSGGVKGFKPDPAGGGGETLFELDEYDDIMPVAAEES